MNRIETFLDQQRAELLAQSEQLRTRLKAIEARLEYLGELAAKVPDETHSHREKRDAAATAPEANGAGHPRKLTRPSDAIVDYIGRHPDCMTRDAVNAVKDHVESAAKDPERMLYSLVRGLIKRGRILRDPMSKKLRVAPETGGN